MMTIRIVYCVGDCAGQEHNHNNHEYDMMNIEMYSNLKLNMTKKTTTRNISCDMNTNLRMNMSSKYLKIIWNGMEWNGMLRGYTFMW